MLGPYLPTSPGWAKKLSMDSKWGLYDLRLDKQSDLLSHLSVMWDCFLEKKLIVAFLIVQGQKKKKQGKGIFFPFYNISRKWSIMQSQIDQLLFLGEMSF